MCVHANSLQQQRCELNAVLLVGFYVTDLNQVLNTNI